MKHIDLQNDLEKTLETKDLREVSSLIHEISIDTGEIFLDQGLDNLLLSLGTEIVEIVEDIPILKSVYSCIKISKDIANLLLIKKLVAFLSPNAIISPKVREKLLQKLGTKKRRQILDDVLLIIDRQDSYFKAFIIGKVFASYLKEEISYSDFQDMSHAISILSISYIHKLVDYYKDKLQIQLESGAGLTYSFAVVGLLKIDNSMIGTWGGGGPTVAKNQLGQTLVSIIDRER